MGFVFSNFILKKGWSELDLYAKSDIFTYLCNYIKGYLKSYDLPETQPLVILQETEYIDHNYLLDYINYYSGCFKEYHKHVVRYHLFLEINETIENAFKTCYNNPDVNEDDDLLCKLNAAYIGFIIVKPFEQRCIGRSLLKHYNISDHVSSRNYPTVIDHKLFIMGLPFKIQSIPYQEQDKSVGACATTAIWNTLSTLKSLFHSSLLYAPSEITNIAFDNCNDSLGRRFPNIGLTKSQILTVYNKIGFDALYYDMRTDNHLERLDKLPDHFIQELIISHLKFGIPILAGLNMSKKMSGKSNVSFETHLVTIVGYKLHPSTNKLFELYLHDDQIGPYCKVTFNDEYSYTFWMNEWNTERNYDYVRLSEIYVPIHNSIRITFTKIYEHLKDEISKNGRSHVWNSMVINNKIHFLLTTSNRFKQDLIKNQVKYKLTADLLDYFMYEHFPKYLWIVERDPLIEDDSLHLKIYDATTTDITPIGSIPGDIF